MSDDKPDVRIHIDQKPLHSPNPTTGVDLYELGQVREGQVLYKEVGGNKEDRLVRIDNPKIDLTQDEHFRSGEAPEKHYVIVVNTDPVVVDHDVLTFDELVEIAFPVQPTGQDPEFTVSFEHAKSVPHHGDLPPNGTVTVRKHGTISMSIIPIDRSPDLQRLRKEGYNIQVTGAGYLVVHDVPYVNSKREIERGALASNLDLAGDITAQPQDHTAKFIGEYPCDSNGKPLDVLKHQSGSYDVGNGLAAQHSFSRKPARGHYGNYHEKMTTYVALLGKHVAAIDPFVTATTHRVIEPEDDNSSFNYLDTASARAEINTITARLAQDAIAIVGVGGTGSYVLDMVAKTPVKQIHIFDADRFLTHNAFRAPGAPEIEDLRAQPLKVEYFASIYAHMHRGIIPHPIHIDATNADKLSGMSFVFLCMEGGAAKRAVVDKLEALGTPFADVGMGLYAKRNSIGGMLRSILSLPDARERTRVRISFATDDANNEYDKNIQVADLNALNACLAVIAWKKLRGFYFNLGKERFVSYTIANGLLAKGDTI